MYRGGGEIRSRIADFFFARSKKFRILDPGSAYGLRPSNLPPFTQ